jgi:hypothetical protein
LHVIHIPFRHSIIIIIIITTIVLSYQTTNYHRDLLIVFEVHGGYLASRCYRFHSLLPIDVLVVVCCLEKKRIYEFKVTKNKCLPTAGPYPTADPLLFCMYHKDTYPEGPVNGSMEHMQAMVVEVAAC